jgi:ribulose-phosphate 3-epimerase
MRPEIYPGILTHTLEEYIHRLEMIEESPAQWAHIDIMDGQFVPNISVMPHEFMSISTRLKLEVHLMTFRPERYFPDLTVAGVSRVLLHREAYQDMEECAEALRMASEYFPEVGLVINPDTEVESYAGLPLASLQCMSVHPGASGQPFLTSAFEQVRAVVAQRLPLTIAVDGGVSEDNIRELHAEGVQRFVITSHLYITNNLPQRFHYFTQLVSGAL